jgi:hypothetical protein
VGHAAFIRNIRHAYNIFVGKRSCGTPRCRWKGSMKCITQKLDVGCALGLSG